MYMDKFIIGKAVITLKWPFGGRLFLEVSAPKLTDKHTFRLLVPENMNKLLVGARTQDPEVIVQKEIDMGAFFCGDGTLVQEKLHNELRILVKQVVDKYNAEVLGVKAKTQ